MMPIIDLFSKRQKRLRGEVPDVYVYNDLPDPLRVKIVHIWMDVLGNRDQARTRRRVGKTYEFIVQSLCHEYGVFILPGAKQHYRSREPIEDLFHFFMKERDIERAIDAIQLSFQAIYKFTRDIDYLGRRNPSEKADSAVDELNDRFKEHGVGYQCINRQIIRIDSELIHSEIVKPALKLLAQPHYAGAQEEFLKAHEHYRKGNAKEALSECLKAFESVMKTICDKRGWQYGSNATARPLIQACFDNELIPPFWESHYSSLRSLLESGVPTGRNKLSGHGQGTSLTTVSDHVVAYMLHMTASAIVFLAEADANLR